MKDIKHLRKMSYFRLSAYYYNLLYKKEIEIDCLNQNYKNVKEISKTYFTEEGHDEENDKIYNLEIETLKYCLKNIKECKRLDNEINDIKVKLLKSQTKLK